MAKRTKSARKAAKKSASVRVYGRLFRFVGFWKECFVVGFIGEKDLKNDLSLSLSHSPNCLYCNRPILSLSLFPKREGIFIRRLIKLIIHILSLSLRSYFKNNNRNRPLRDSALPRVKATKSGRNRKRLR
jgi:hypothetical protein